MLEPRKPMTLGTMFRNGVDATNGILAYQDVVQFSEIQKQKEHHAEKYHLPNVVDINAHCAETMRQAERANTVEGGGRWRRLVRQRHDGSGAQETLALELHLHHQ
jgi:hypothetical protein